ncbi:MAG: 3-deoxy-manno-octulosonate cytidylyltransferase [Muribaculaceae bacterium]|nr:3-deoxy-manno-octulosonate cytidylyltransferase [Muribaculaceae bacterium]
MDRRFIVIIPARYGSSRFPGKPLAKIGGEEMIVRVCRRAAETGATVAVATDDERIRDCVEKAGFTAVMTSPDHKSGTDRVYEAFCKLGKPADVIINVQGDEPFIVPSQIKALMKCFEEDGVGLATLVRKFDKNLGFEALFDPNLVKVVCGEDGNALYFSRSIIPYIRSVEWKEWLDKHTFLTHVGIYAYRSDVLGEITRLERSPLEKAESLEQLRWLENGYSIKTAVTPEQTIGIDTPADLEAAERWLASQEGKDEK